MVRNYHDDGVFIHYGDESRLSLNPISESFGSEQGNLQWSCSNSRSTDSLADYRDFPSCIEQAVFANKMLIAFIIRWTATAESPRMVSGRKCNWNDSGRLSPADFWNKYETRFFTYLFETDTAVPRHGDKWSCEVLDKSTLFNRRTNASRTQWIILHRG